MKVIQPYVHDCPLCKWVGWINVGDIHGNMYICKKGQMIEIVIRWSSDPPDYSCYSYFEDNDRNPHPLQIGL